MRSAARSFAAGVAVAVTAAALAACGTSDPGSSEPSTLTLGVDAIQANAWDAVGGGTPSDLPQYDAVYDTIVHWNYDTATGDPWLAEELTMSDDHRSIDLKLRDDVDFIDGTHMDAEGVVKYYTALVAGDYGLNGTWAPYELTFTATGDYTFRVDATSPIYYYEVVRLLFSETPVESPAVLDDPEGAMVSPIGSGPYVIDSASEVEMTLVRNLDYWNVEAYPYDRVVLKLIADPVARLNALKSGQIDGAQLTTPLASEAESAGFAVHQFGGAYNTLMVRDPANSAVPALRDVRVREAMALSFDRESISESLYLGYSRPSSQAFGAGQAQYIEGGDERYGYDLEKARDLMAEAGYADGFDITIPVATPTVDIEPIVLQSLGDIGIRVTFDRVDDGAWFPAMLSGDYPVSLFPGLDYHNTVRVLSEEFTGLGHMFEQTPEVKALITSIKQGDDAESAEASTELGELLLDELWYIPFSTVPSFWVTTPEIDVAETEAVQAYLGARLTAFKPAE